MNNRHIPRVAAFALVAGTVLLSSCASLMEKAPRSNWQKGMEEREPAREMNDYLLGPDDEIHLTVGEHPEWTGDFTIRPDGRIFVIGLGEFKLEGLSRYGAEVAVGSRLDELINNPRVTIDIVRYASQVVYVLGEVARPGRYSTEGKNMTVRDAIVTAGLPTRYAATGRVFVITPAPRKTNRQVVNLDRILYHGELQRNIALNPGDIVYVPQNLIGMINDLLSSLLSPLTTTLPAAQTIVAPVPIP